MALKYHMEEAIAEKQITKKVSATSCPPFAIFSNKYYNDIKDINYDKKYDFCFIGSIKSCFRRRKWVIDFAKKYFTDNSVFINTDKNPAWELLGSFDYSTSNMGFCPKEQPNNQSKKVQYRVVKDNIDYFEKMRQSKFVLCPAGDAPWSFRFYEVLMCQSIPIVESWHHTYRTKEEATLNYKYVLCQDMENIENIKNTKVNYEEYVNENENIFQHYHLLN
jgi:hypothetical protein